MVEITWHGRGGQGAFTSARILGTAWSLKNESCHALAFPAFGPERRGAPVRAFTKLSAAQINNRSEILKNDFLVCLDDTLFGGSVLPALKPDGKLILNTVKKYSDPRIVTIDADRIANGILKRPVTSTAMLGALMAIWRGIDLESMEKAVAMTMPEHLVKKNIAVIHAAAEALR